MLQSKKYTETTNQHSLQHNWYCVEEGDNTTRLLDCTID